MWSDPARSCVGQGSAAGAGAGVREASWRGRSWEERELQAEGLPVQRPRGRRALGASKGWRGARGLTGWSGWVPGPTWRTGCLVYSCGRRRSHSLHRHQEVLSDSVSSLSPRHVGWGFLPRGRPGYSFNKRSGSYFASAFRWALRHSRERARVAGIPGGGHQDLKRRAENMMLVRGKVLRAAVGTQARAVTRGHWGGTSDYLEGLHEGGGTLSIKIVAPWAFSTGHQGIGRGERAVLGGLKCLLQRLGSTSLP